MRDYEANTNVPFEFDAIWRPMRDPGSVISCKKIREIYMFSYDVNRVFGKS